MVDALLRLSEPLTYDYSSVPYEQDVYSFVLTKLEEYDSYYSTWSESAFNEERIIILSVQTISGAGVALYTEKASLSQCVTDEETWYYDKENQVLYIHYPFDMRPELLEPRIGMLRGYLSDNLHYIDDIKYEPRLTNAPVIKKTVDPLNVGKMKFQDFTATIKNPNGELDDYIVSPIPGSLGQYVLYDDDAGTELVYYTGRVRSVKYTVDEISVKLIDIRRAENIKIPTARFNKTDYPDINDKWVNKIIPDGYGLQLWMPAYPINEDATGSPDIIFKYGFSGISSAVAAVWVEIDDEWVEIDSSYVTYDDTNGEFTVTRAHVIGSGKSTAYDCVVYAVGLGTQGVYSVDEIIAANNLKYGGITYDSSNYNITEFEAEGLLAGQSATLYMDKQKEMFKWVEDLQKGCDRNFIYEYQGDGKRTIRTDYESRTSSANIDYPKIKNDLREVNEDFESFSSSIEILYSKDYRYDTTQIYEDITYQESAIKRHGYAEKRTITANLTSPTKVEEKAARLALDQSESRPVFTVRTHGDSLSKLVRKLYEVITVDTSIPEETVKETVEPFYFNPDGEPFYFAAESNDVAFYQDPDGEPFYFNPDGNDLIQLSPGDLPDIFYFHPPDDIIVRPAREYFGEVTGKVIGIKYERKNRDYTLEVREVAS